MKRSAAEILRDYGPFPDADHVHGVTFDGQHVWFASGDKLSAFDPESGKTVRSINIAERLLVLSGNKERVISSRT